MKPLPPPSANDHGAPEPHLEMRTTEVRQHRRHAAHAGDQAGRAMSAPPAAGSVVELAAGDLPAYCPNPSMPLWASHPRVFLDVVNESVAMCPYCGTRYRLKRGVHVRAHEFGSRDLHQDRHQQHAAQPVINPPAPDSLNSRPDAPQVAVDALGNTTLEQMTRWLKSGR